MGDDGGTPTLKRRYRLTAEGRARVRDRIAAELAQPPDAAFGSLYGSCIGPEEFHDVDIGVYLSGNRVSEGVAADSSQHLSGAVKLPVDVRILNAAPVSLRFHVLRGELILSHDDDLLGVVMEDTVRRYLDIAPPLLRQSTKEAFASWA